MENKSLRKLELLEDIVEMTGNEELINHYKFLYDRISAHESYVVFLGETSSGKSSIINGLIGENLLPVKASPSTGAITEVDFTSGKTELNYSAINKDATIEELNKDMFLQLGEHPDSDLSRLRLYCPYSKLVPDGCIIFDTPGYDSIITEHEEILKNFIPNSDIVVYTVNYKIGIQNSDYVFLRSLKSLIGKDIPVLLVINRCPLNVSQNDRKVRKITQYVSDIMGIKNLNAFLIKNVLATDGVKHPLVSCDELWLALSDILMSEKRKLTLEESYDIYISDLLNECDSVISGNYLSSKIDNDNYKKLLNEKKEYYKRFKKSIDKFIIPTFDEIEKKLPKLIEQARMNTEDKVDKDIDNSSTFASEEMVTYINEHSVPYNLGIETREIQRFVECEIDHLNKEVDDYIQKELIGFNNSINIILNTNLDNTTKSLIKKTAKKITINSLEKYFSAYGGIAGSGAGVANAASHWLKESGAIFGKTFSRSTHNSVKHFIAKIGASSMRAVGSVVAVVIEALSMAVDLSTWKKNLKNKLHKGFNEWEEKNRSAVLKDLQKLREENINDVEEVAEKLRGAFSNEQKPEDFKKWKDGLSIIEEVKLNMDKIA